MRPTSLADRRHIADVKGCVVADKAVVAVPQCKPAERGVNADRIGNVEQVVTEAAAGIARPLRFVRRGIGVHIDHPIPCLFIQAGPRNGRSDAAGGSGEEDAPALKQHRHPLTRNTPSPGVIALHRSSSPRSRRPCP